MDKSIVSTVSFFDSRCISHHAMRRGRSVKNIAYSNSSTETGNNNQVLDKVTRNPSYH